MMTLPLLVARQTEPAEFIMPEPQLVPTPTEWLARYSEMERLYVYERRKLHFVMRYMERKHGFKATEQMYKKRFAKWGFQKNTKRSDTVVSTVAIKGACRTQPRRRRTRAGQLGSIPLPIQLGHHDNLILSLLSGVRNWSVAFFESIHCCDRPLSIQQPSSERIKQTSFTLKLVSDLLDRGQGVLAGRMARKAFLLVEDILTLEAPALVWNLLEIMYQMVTLCHEQLFVMLLAHVSALINGRMSTTHPLSAMLYDLRRLVASETSMHPAPGGSLFTSSSSSSSCSSSPSPSLFSPSTGGDSNYRTTTFHPGFTSHTILPLLQEAWLLNAKTLFENFDPRFFQLYFHLHWESCSISLPTAIIGAVKQWLRHIETQQMPPDITDAYRNKDAGADTPVAEDGMLRLLLAPRTDASPPRNYEMLRASSVSALWEYAKPILSKGFIFNTNSVNTLRIMPALVKAKFLEAYACVVERSSPAGSETTIVSRSQAGNVACVVRALIDLNAGHGGEKVGVLPGDVERIRSIVALREYACGEMDPQVMREMWLLEDALAATGEIEMAQEVKQTVLRRLERYAHDVPSESV